MTNPIDKYVPLTSSRGQALKALDLEHQLAALEEEHGAEVLLTALSRVFAIKAEAYADDAPASWLAANWQALNKWRSDMLKRMADNRALIK